MITATSRGDSHPGVVRRVCPGVSANEHAAFCSVRAYLSESSGHRLIEQTCKYCDGPTSSFPRAQSGIIISRRTDWTASCVVSTSRILAIGGERWVKKLAGSDYGLIGDRAYGPGNVVFQRELRSCSVSCSQNQVIWPDIVQ